MGFGGNQTEVRVKWLFLTMTEDYDIRWLGDKIEGKVKENAVVNGVFNHPWPLVRRPCKYLIVREVHLDGRRHFHMILYFDKAIILDKKRSGLSKFFGTEVDVRTFKHEAHRDYVIGSYVLKQKETEKDFQILNNGIDTEAYREKAVKAKSQRLEDKERPFDYAYELFTSGLDLEEIRRRSPVFYAEHYDVLERLYKAAQKNIDEQNEL